MMNVASDEKHGKYLLRRAEEIEEIRMHQTTADHALSIYDDRSASIFMSGSIKDVGTITKVNSAALQMFGYTRAEMEGHDVSMLMPRPFATFHSTFLRRYLDSARSSLLNRVKTLFALHKNGFFFEVRLGKWKFVGCCISDSS